jgi:hypothetical protein
LTPGCSKKAKGVRPQGSDTADVALALADGHEHIADLVADPWPRRADNVHAAPGPVLRAIEVIAIEQVPGHSLVAGGDLGLAFEDLDDLVLAPGFFERRDEQVGPGIACEIARRRAGRLGLVWPMRVEPLLDARGQLVPDLRRPVFGP